MKVSPNGIGLIRGEEGLRLDAYLDGGGVPTIGYGATFYQDGKKVQIGDKINVRQAVELQQYHVNLFSSKILPLITAPINQNQFDALVSFAYNVGAEAFKTSTLLKIINKNPNDPAIRTQFRRWNKDNGKVVKGLINRREHEANLYFKPIQS